MRPVHWSTLKAMDVSPRAYRWLVDHPREDTPALRLGRAIHCAILEPEKYDSRYAVATGRQCEATTKAGARCSKNAVAWSPFCSLHGGETPDGVDALSASEHETVQRCADAVLSHPAAGGLLDDCPRRELSIEWEALGLPCAGRIDALGTAAVADLKSTRSLLSFDRDVARYAYHGALAWYAHGAVASGYATSLTPWIIAVETMAPYDVDVLRIAGHALEAGHAMWRRLLAELRECLRTDSWPGRHPVARDLELPSWALDASEEVEL